MQIAAGYSPLLASKLSHRQDSIGLLRQPHVGSEFSSQWCAARFSFWTSLFILYVADIGEIIKLYGLELHFYADDYQIYSSCQPTDVDKLWIFITTVFKDQRVDGS